MSPIPKQLTRLRKFCLGLPEAHEVRAWGEPTFRVKNKMFAMYAAANNHHGEGRESVWCKAAPDSQAMMVRVRPDRYFVPPYVGPSGWVGIYLDQRPAWKEIEEVLTDAFMLAAPKRVQAAFASRTPARTGKQR